jgi:peptide deformylase
MLPDPADQAGTGSLVVDHDDATLHYDGHTYRLTQRRHLVNGGTEPITRYLIRISVDRYPGDPERSNQLYSENPLTWDEIDLHAWHGQDRAEPMDWTAHHDRDAFKEVWLLFVGENGHFPLYPDESTWIEYEYTVHGEHWGNWVQRAVRLPTRTLSVCLDFPAELAPAVWGLHTSMTAQAMPFRTAIARDDDGDRHVFSWSCEDPPLHARYRLEWDFRSHATTQDEPPAAPSEIMSSLGVVQDGDPMLRRVARPFDLPNEAEDARRVVTALNSAAERIAGVHTFGKGMGIAAPQIGIERAAAIVRTRRRGDHPVQPQHHRIRRRHRRAVRRLPVVLRCARASAPLAFHPRRAHQHRRDEEDHNLRTRRSRLVAHEVDHLHGHLYTDRMSPGVDPIPVEQYRGTGTTWKY